MVEWVGFALWGGNFYRSETFTLMNQSPVSQSRAALRFLGERIRRSELGETILSVIIQRRNSATMRP
jgi:hypothetical protein